MGPDLTKMRGCQNHCFARISRVSIQLQNAFGSPNGHGVGSSSSPGKIESSFCFSGRLGPASRAFCFSGRLGPARGPIAPAQGRFYILRAYVFFAWVFSCACLKYDMLAPGLTLVTMRVYTCMCKYIYKYIYTNVLVDLRGLWMLVGRSELFAPEVPWPPQKHCAGALEATLGL